MKLPNWTRLLDPRAWAVLAIMVLAMLAFWFFVIRPANNARKAQEATIEAGLSAARTEAAKDAMGVVENDARAAAETDKKVKDAIEAIRASDDPDRAALDELCGFESAARLPECVQ